MMFFEQLGSIGNVIIFCILCVIFIFLTVRIITKVKELFFLKKLYDHRNNPEKYKEIIDTEIGKLKKEIEECDQKLKEIEKKRTK